MAVAVWLVEFSCVTVIMSLKKAVADPTWLQSTIATRHGMCVVYNVVYMGKVNNSNKTWHVCSVQHCVHGYSQQ